MADAKITGMIEITTNIPQALNAAISAIKTTKKEADALKSSLSSLSRSRISIQVERSAVDTAAKAIKDMQMLTRASTKLSIDASSANAAIDKLKHEVNSLKAEKAKIMLSTDEAAAKIKALEAEVNRLKGQNGKIKVNVDTSRAKSEVGELKSMLLELAGSAFTIKTAVDLGKTGIEYQAAIERSVASWTTLLGSEKAAASNTETLVDMTKNTPFSMEAIEGAARKLNMAGYQGQELYTSLTNVGDAVAAIGGNSDTLDGVALALFQISTKGKLYSQEVLQLAERGIAVWDILEDKMGMSRAELTKMGEEGKLLADEVLPMIIEGMGERYGGAMENYSRTFSGLQSKAGELSKQFLASSTKGMFDSLKSAATDYNEYMQSADAKAFSASISDALGVATSAVIAFGKVLAANKEIVIGFAAGFATFKTAMAIAPIFISATKAIKDYMAAVKGASLWQKATTWIWALPAPAKIALGVSAAVGAFAAIWLAASEAQKQMAAFNDTMREASSDYSEAFKQSADNYKTGMDDLAVVTSEAQKAMSIIEGGAKGYYEAAVLNDTLERYPELAQYIKKIGGAWEYDKEKLEEYFNLQERALKTQKEREEWEAAVKLDNAAKDAYGENKTNFEKRLEELSAEQQAFVMDMYERRGEKKTADIIERIASGKTKLFDEDGNIDSESNAVTSLVQEVSNGLLDTGGGRQIDAETRKRLASLIVSDAIRQYTNTNKKEEEKNYADAQTQEAAAQSEYETKAGGYVLDKTLFPELAAYQDSFSEVFNDDSIEKFKSVWGKLKEGDYSSAASYLPKGNKPEENTLKATQDAFYSYTAGAIASDGDAGSKIQAIADANNSAILELQGIINDSPDSDAANAAADMIAQLKDQQTGITDLLRVLNDDKINQEEKSQQIAELLSGTLSLVDALVTGDSPVEQPKENGKESIETQAELLNTLGSLGRIVDLFPTGPFSLEEMFSNFDFTNVTTGLTESLNGASDTLAAGVGEASASAGQELRTGITDATAGAAGTLKEGVVSGGGSAAMAIHSIGGPTGSVIGSVAKGILESAVVSVKVNVPTVTARITGGSIRGFLPGKHAKGTDYYTGGLTWVGEEGPELLELPAGAKITPNNKSLKREIAADDVREKLFKKQKDAFQQRPDNNRSVTNHISISGEFNVRKNDDIDEIARKLAEKIDRAAKVMA